MFDTKEDVTVCFITTRLNWQSEYDLSIEPSTANGLKKPSLIRLNKLATIDKDLITGKLGMLEDHYVLLLN